MLPITLNRSSRYVRLSGITVAGLPQVAAW